MKSSTMMAIALCGVLACAVTGCKYDDEAVDDNNSIATSTEIPTDSDDLNDKMADGKDLATEDELAKKNADANDLTGIKDEEGASATGLPFDQDPNYVRCTDVDFEPVYFGFDAANLQTSELAKIEKVAAHLKQTGRVVIIEGNCDERGSNEYNLVLGETRAISIREYLMTLGIDPQKVQTKSYGEEKPAIVGTGEAAWSKNRRGEFAVYAHK